MFEFIDRRSDAQTPPMIKVSVIIQAILFFGSLSHTARLNELGLLLAVVNALLYFLTLIAFWHLRRWSVISLIVLAVIPLLFFGPIQQAHPISVIVGLFIKVMLILPGFIYWNIMKW